MDEKIYAGHIQEPHDSRDYLTKEFFGSSEPFDWQKGFDIEEKLSIKLPVNDQKSSYSCVGQATSKDREVKEFVDTGIYLDRSAKSIYAFRSNSPIHGMNPRDAKQIEQNRGVALRKDIPDTGIESEMTEPPVGNYDVTKSKVFMSFEFYDNIDEIAKHIRDYDGCTFAYDGRNNGTNYNEHPTLPDHWDNVQWSHFVYAGKAKVVNGEKRIYFLNSWGEKCGVNGWQYFTEEDFKTKQNGYNPFYQGWVTVDLINNDNKRMAEQFIKENEGELVQMTGQDGTGEFGTIVHGQLLHGNQLKVVLTYLVRKFGKGIPKTLWDAMPKKDIESK